MIPPIDSLVQQEVVAFAPRSGTFDVAAIAAAIAGIGYSFRDEIDPTRFAIAPDEKTRDSVQAGRRAKPPGRFEYLPLVEVLPTRITMWPIATHAASRAVSEEFLAWLTANQACEFMPDFDDGGEEVPDDDA